MLSNSVPSIMFILRFLYHQFSRILNCNFPFWVLTEKVLRNLKCILLFLMDFFRCQLFCDYSITLSVKCKCFLPNFICFLQNVIAIFPGQELREERPWRSSWNRGLGTSRIHFLCWAVNSVDFNHVQILFHKNELKNDLASIQVSFPSTPSGKPLIIERFLIPLF